MGKSCKLGHVRDTPGEGDDGGPASKQVRKPLRGLKARVVVVEGEEDTGAAPEGGCHPFDPLGAQRSDGWNPHLARASQSKTPSATTASRRRGAKPAKSKHRLGAGKRLEPGSLVGIDGPSHEPADKSAGGVGNDDHAGEPLRARSMNSPSL